MTDNTVTTTVYGTRYTTDRYGNHVFKMAANGDRIQCGRGGESFSSAKQMGDWIRRNLAVTRPE